MRPTCLACFFMQILKRINATISQRIAAGENLPPPPRTAIAGPEYFGLNDLSTIVSGTLWQPRQRWQRQPHLRSIVGSSCKSLLPC